MTNTRKSVVRIGALLCVRTSRTCEKRCIIHLDLYRWLADTTISCSYRLLCSQRGGKGLIVITNRGGTGCARGVGVTVPTVAVALFQWPGLGTETHNISDIPGECDHKWMIDAAWTVYRRRTKS